MLLVLLDGVEFAATFLGAMWIGAVPLPLNPLLPGEDLAVADADSRARVAFISGERLVAAPDLVAAAAELDHLVVVGEGEPPWIGGVDAHPFAPLMGSASGAPPYETWEDSPGF